jgi:hypothetical protein
MVGTDFCLCELRKRKWLGAQRALRAAGWRALIAVQQVVLHDQPSAHNIADLQVGLWALAQHFGLTKSGKSDYRYVASQLDVLPST